MSKMWKKTMAGLIITVILLSGGALTALSMDLSKSPNAYENLGEYFHKNEKIIKNFAKLTPEQYQQYENDPDSIPKDKFPFGIDFNKNAPIGYPSCIAATDVGTYEQTRELPSCCSDIDDEEEPVLSGKVEVMYTCSHGGEPGWVITNGTDNEVQLGFNVSGQLRNSPTHIASGEQYFIKNANWQRPPDGYIEYWTWQNNPRTRVNAFACK